MLGCNRFGVEGLGFIGFRVLGFWASNTGPSSGAVR